MYIYVYMYISIYVYMYICIYICNVVKALILIAPSPHKSPTLLSRLGGFWSRSSAPLEAPCQINRSPLLWLGTTDHGPPWPWPWPCLGTMSMAMPTDHGHGHAYGPWPWPCLGTQDQAPSSVEEKERDWPASKSKKIEPFYLIMSHHP